ncbi:hypothetical protein C1645_751275 [Glomus cerebriforme]|uniref:Reelin domain-containing protein n=1 Tax=Glomus cerebriforme TaxID=658196 RepID=A0A397TKQ6_9GLOM|nr:hypothetical protein C1645_751275 [Glomus cerebriforme]
MKSLKLFILLVYLLIPSVVLSKKRLCKQRWYVPNAETATITFDSESLSGRFVLYDNLHGSGTQVKGLFERGLVRQRWLPPNYSYKFIAFIKSTCDKLTDNVFYQIDVTDSFVPRRKGFINERGGMDKMIKTTMFSWYWGPNVDIAIVVYENQANVKRELWKKISCTEVVNKPDTLSNIVGDDAMDDDDE